MLCFAGKHSHFGPRYQLLQTMSSEAGFESDESWHVGRPTVVGAVDDDVEDPSKRFGKLPGRLRESKTLRLGLRGC